MSHQKINISDRPTVKPALIRAEATGGPAVAIELEDGTIIQSKTSNLLTAPAALILNALKHITKINDDLNLISPSIIEPISKMKTKDLAKLIIEKGC